MTSPREPLPSINKKLRVDSNVACCSLQIVTFNMHGFTQGQAAVKEMITEYSPDVFLLQEHWLTPTNLNKFDHCFHDYFTFGCSAMAKTLESGILRGRPYGGVMIVIKNSLRGITETVFCAERCATVHIANCVIVNVYLPCARSDNRLSIVEDILTECWSWCERYSDCNVIFSGDFNADLNKSDTISTTINGHIADHSLRRCDVLFHNNNLITYDNIALGQSSCIDYILTSCENMVTNFDVLDLNLNFSDHHPIIVSCQVKFSKSVKHDKAPAVNAVQFRWDHADLALYYKYTGCCLQPVLDKADLFITHSSNSDLVDYVRLHAINVLYGDIVNVLVSEMLAL